MHTDVSQDWSLSAKYWRLGHHLVNYALSATQYNRHHIYQSAKYNALGHHLSAE